MESSVATFGKVRSNFGERSRSPGSTSITPRSKSHAVKALTEEDFLAIVDFVAPASVSTHSHCLSEFRSSSDLLSDKKVRNSEMSVP